MSDLNDSRRRRALGSYQALKWVAILLLLTGVAGFSTAAKSGLPGFYSKSGTRLLRSTKIIENHREEIRSTWDTSQTSSPKFLIGARQRDRVVVKREVPFLRPSFWFTVRQLRSPPLFA